ncbi:hypothetical protein GO755_10650 [Spirosoma sp. HMF4905]|uniref:Uncharacterized protein n=1 Tax=Spirosoma arboris TaxID=2682092 RepID=A0A7K1S9H6_9BACT|nr:hypothetical protein [Spirosoma arboris]MVM30493.1 hypothetical protein [Spirosoma arboris]
MRYLIFLLTLLVSDLYAQPKLTGLGQFIIGITTPDSLANVDIKELEQSYVKGTLALPCTHIRAFASNKATIDGLPVTNLSLFFYDNKLFRISCDYTDELQKVFSQQYGKGTLRPTTHLTFCDKGKDRSMLVWGEIWQNKDILALALHAKGYNADCQLEQLVRLTITSQEMSTLSSDCELRNSGPFAEEFEEVLNESQRSTEKGGLKKGPK